MRLCCPVGRRGLALALLGTSLALSSALLWSTPAKTDEIRPALLDVKEQNTGLYSVRWKVPTRGDRVLPLVVRLPENLELVGTPILED